MSRIDLIFVGGFLGAGKTTLLHTAARTLSRRGRRVGLVTNDQAPQLFDTALLGAAGPVAEVAGQCFCCGLDDLLGALDSLAEQGVDCILAEPVGSCTDLSATLLQPLKDRHGERFRLAPLTVLADPDRLLDALEARSSDLHEATAYIYGLQLEEADRILVTKSDSLDEGVGDAIVGLTRQAYSVPVDAIAAASGEGVAQWLDTTLAGGPVGARVLDIDYDRYALGEAVLGWLNATVRVSAAHTRLPALLVGSIRDQAAASDAPIGHVKALLSDDGPLALAQCTAVDGPVHTSRLGQPSGAPAQLVLNARVQITPETLEAWVEHALTTALESTGTTAEVLDKSCFSPAYPRPTVRYDHVV